MRFYIYLINRIRVIFKSFYKREKKISNLITYLVWKKKINKYKIEIPDFNKKFENLEYKNNIDFLPKNSFLKSRVSYLFIFLLNFFKLISLINKKKPDYIIYYANKLFI